MQEILTPCTLSTSEAALERQGPYNLSRSYFIRMHLQNQDPGPHFLKLMELFHANRYLLRNEISVLERISSNSILRRKKRE